jgi:hypothetical protein
MRYTIILSTLVLLSFAVSAQQSFMGRIYKKGSKEVLNSVSIQNLTRSTYNLSDQGGNFKIQASDGDTMIFSSAGYQTDTLLISSNMFAGEYQVYMEPRVVSLAAVRVGSLSNYQLDSMERRKDYDWVYGRRGNTPVLDKKKAGDGVGASMTLPSFSTGDRQIEKLRKRLNTEEEDYYIDSRFTREYVTRLTHLQGEALDQFMAKYRPAYKWCRMANNTDMLLWINDSYKKFKGQK